MNALRNFLVLCRRNHLFLQSHVKKHTLPELPYDYNALEPILCKEIIEMHHKKHHQMFVDNLNNAEERMRDCDANLSPKARECLLQDYNVNLGGHVNHSIFWRNYSPVRTQLDGELLDLINRQFGSVECLKEKLAEAADCVAGAGWAWLGYNRGTNCLEIATTSNEDRLLQIHCLYPLIAVDVWEHAYYLQYLDARPHYTRAMLEIINWEDVRQRYLDAKCGIVKIG